MNEGRYHRLSLSLQLGVCIANCRVLSERKIMSGENLSRFQRRGPMPRTLFSRIAATALLSAMSCLPLAAQRQSFTGQSFTIRGNQFLLDGKPFQILSGEMHYARIPRAYWRARMEMAKAMGLNTIATYVFWNVHEPEPGVWNFTGNDDLPEFLREAQQEGLHVILRAGPYSPAPSGSSAGFLRGFWPIQR